MELRDVRLIETYNGGDFVLRGNDVQMVGGFQNMPYIALFGGNKKQSTSGAKVTEQTFDYWGNFAFYPTNKDVWFNSETERTFDNIELSSRTRSLIEQQVLKDLEFMRQFAEIRVNVVITGNHRIQINIDVIEPTTQQLTQFQYIWNSTEFELTTSDGLPTNQEGSLFGLDYPIEFEL